MNISLGLEGKVTRNGNLTLSDCFLILSPSFSQLCRIPVQYIIGEWDFRNVTLLMQPPVFIPEPETEVWYMVYVRYNNGTCVQLNGNCSGTLMDTIIFKFSN